MTDIFRDSTYNLMKCNLCNHMDKIIKKYCPVSCSEFSKIRWDFARFDISS